MNIDRGLHPWRNGQVRFVAPEEIAVRANDNHEIRAPVFIKACIRCDANNFAVEAADLTETLATGGTFTVFAPTDEAFSALPEGTVEALLADIPTLTDILLYHVVDGEVTSEVVVTLESATTLLGQDVTIEVTNAGVMLNGSAMVTVVDVAASNGVIHIIDAVILPPETK